jgi:hypothetical protein
MKGQEASHSKMAPSTRVRRVALCLCASGFFFALLLLASLPARLRVPEHPLLHRFEHIGHRFDVSREELNLLMHAPSPVRAAAASRARARTCGGRLSLTPRAHAAGSF